MGTSWSQVGNPNHSATRMLKPKERTIKRLCWELSYQVFPRQASILFTLCELAFKRNSTHLASSSLVMWLCLKKKKEPCQVKKYPWGAGGQWGPRSECKNALSDLGHCCPLIMMIIIWVFFTFLSISLKSYWDDGSVIIKGSVQWNAVHSWAELHHQWYSNLTPHDPKSRMITTRPPRHCPFTESLVTIEHTDV